MPSAARASDSHDCPLVNTINNTPHEGGPILRPCATTVLINGQQAARVGDRALCLGNVPPDTIRGGCIAVMIQGAPASRKDDATDQGKIMGGSPNVNIADWGGGPLTPGQAKWLFNYLYRQRDNPFGYADHGCTARADRMASWISALGIPVKKQWAYAPEGESLHVNIPNYPDNGASWDHHVAPVIDVYTTDDATNKAVPMIIDPSIAQSPLTVDAWKRRFSNNPSKVKSLSTDISVYQRIEHGGGLVEQLDFKNRKDSDRFTSEALNLLRDKRAALPESSNRNIPNEPTHF